MKTRITPSNKIFSKRNMWNLRHNIAVETTNISLHLYLNHTNCYFRIWKPTQRIILSTFGKTTTTTKNSRQTLSLGISQKGSEVEFCFLRVRERTRFSNKSLWASAWQKWKKVSGKMKVQCVRESMPSCSLCVREKRGEGTQKIRLSQPGLWRELWKEQ